MTSIDIREIDLTTSYIDNHPHAGSPGETSMTEMLVVIAGFLREIAAQLAEIKEKR